MKLRRQNVVGIKENVMSYSINNKSNQMVNDDLEGSEALVEEDTSQVNDKEFAE